MAVLTRIYATRDQARAAYDALVKNEFGTRSIALLLPAAPSPQPPDTAAPAATPAYVPPQVAGISRPDVTTPPAAVAAAPQTTATDATRDAVRAGTLLGAEAEYFLDRVNEGLSVVAVDPPFGRSARAIDLLDAQNPIEPAADAPPAPVTVAEPYRTMSERSTPLSSALGFKVLGGGADPLSRSCGFPTLSRGRSFMSRWFAELSATDFTVSAIFGMPIRSRKATPLSSLLGMPVSSGRSGDGWKRSFGLRMLSNRAAPLSAFFGIPLLKGHYRHEDYAPARDESSVRNRAAPLSDVLWISPLAKNRHSNLVRMFPALTQPGFALSSLLNLPLLSREAAPLSKLLNLRTRSGDSAKQWKSSFGFPLISKNPAPLSSFLGLRVLSRSRLLY